MDLNTNTLPDAKHNLSISYDNSNYELEMNALDISLVDSSVKFRLIGYIESYIINSLESVITILYVQDCSNEISTSS